MNNKKFSTPFVAAINDQLKTRVDAKQYVIYGFQVCRMGEAKGHPGNIDSTTLDQIVAFGNAAENGVKSRFDHPSMCLPSFGTYLGSVKNFTRDDDGEVSCVRADLHLSSSADLSPQGKLAAYVLDMAVNNPDKFGASISCAGEWVTPDVPEGTDPDADVPLVLRLSELIAVDFVDDPAATDGLFAAPIEGVRLNAGERDIVQKIFSNPEMVSRAAELLEFYKRIYTGDPPGKDNTMSEPKETAGATVIDATPEQLAAARKEGEELGVKNERARVTAILGKAKPEHYAATQEYKTGFVAHAIKTGLSVEDAYGIMLDLSEKAAGLALLEAQSGSRNIGPSGAPDDSPEKAAADQLSAATKRVMARRGMTAN